HVTPGGMVSYRVWAIVSGYSPHNRVYHMQDFCTRGAAMEYGARSVNAIITKKSPQIEWQTVDDRWGRCHYGYVGGDYFSIKFTISEQTDGRCQLERQPDAHENQDFTW